MRLMDVGMQGMEIDAILYESEGELTESLEQRLDALLKDGSSALESAAFVCRRMDADIELCDREIARLQERKKSMLAGQEFLKARMLFAVDGAFNGKLKTPIVTIWGQDAAKVTSIEVSPDADLDKMWQTDSSLLRRTLALNKLEIKHRYDAGDPIPSEITVTELPGKRSLRMR